MSDWASNNTDLPDLQHAFGKKHYHAPFRKSPYAQCVTNTERWGLAACERSEGLGSV